MSTRVLEFRLGRPHVLPDVLMELGLHDNVNVSVREDDLGTVVVVEVLDTSSATWTIRATVREFDETAELL